MIDIEELVDSDKRLVIDLIPRKDLFDFIKTNSKYFSKDLIGIRIDKKSKVLQQKLPEIILKNLEQKDIPTLKFISTDITIQVEEINEYVKVKLDEDRILEEIFPSNNLANF